VLLIESIHETIAQLLSLEIAEMLFEHIEKVYSIKKDDLIAYGAFPIGQAKLLFVLKAVFGSSGSQVIGKAIAKRFYSRLGLEFSDDPQRTLIAHVGRAKLTQHE